jgi:hypothetical protein
MSASSKSKVHEFLARLINNNESNYFYLESNGDLLSDSVAFLRLSIALRASLHYNTCLDAKILQLTDMFQAKLGWLVGQLYSRVGPEDRETSALQKKIGYVLEDVAIWVDNQKLRLLEAELDPLSADGAAPIDRQVIRRTLSKLPTKKKQVIDRIAALFEQEKTDNNQKFIAKLLRRLSDDAELTALLK